MNTKVTPLVICLHEQSTLPNDLSCSKDVILRCVVAPVAWIAMVNNDESCIWDRRWFVSLWLKRSLQDAMMINDAMNTYPTVSDDALNPLPKLLLCKRSLQWWEQEIWWRMIMLRKWHMTTQHLKRKQLLHQRRVNHRVWLKGPGHGWGPRRFGWRVSTYVWLLQMASSEVAVDLLDMLSS